ncbi:malto-oligosyltrehalose trehalohydrolase [Rhizobium wuzhouense]|uniref:Malto-oligosyltrehalose trehalohydrolase n=1 Tax=Rhizobium wuzhouense TaxID=1986026 RepID=A0ABX5NWL7_9HYPH|nr:malto-oligosyltrehalose trehalohydrolase [Rhizobium wuzhouense]PYB77557.1 malto-oligosyltrehalose trehalohydrolase [Rhizobium wuzhouense]
MNVAQRPTANGGRSQSRVSPKSWGAECTAAGEVRFRIWAPSLTALTLRLADKDMPMSRTFDGWFELSASNVAPGTPYAYVLPDGLVVPDPAGRALKDDVHGPSLVIDPTAYRWRDGQWQGRPWREAVVYELHVGTFTAEGTFTAAAEKLADLAEAGISVVELMPVAAFGGTRGWGYDGVLLHTPHPSYGTPDDMKAFIDHAHELGLMVMLDVVYNHFGIDGNYLSVYAPEMMHEEGTPWGPTIDFERKPSRDFVIENALYWLEEFHLDGLRFDAADQIRDETSTTHILEELALAVRERLTGRHVHLVLEDARGITRFHERDKDNSVRFYDGVWNDGYHHLIHAWATGEHGGHYKPFARDFWPRIGKTLASGFALQGETIEGRGDEIFGEPSGHLPPVTFVNFIQNHDQVGNRVGGDRLWAQIDKGLRERLMAILLLSPQIPLVFMGDEFASRSRFFFFSDYPEELQQNTPDDRLQQARDFGAGDDVTVDDVPDPNGPETFRMSKLDWEEMNTSNGREARAYFKTLVGKRRDHLMPLLENIGGDTGQVLKAQDGILAVDWQLGETLWQLRANFTDVPVKIPPVRGQVIHVLPGSAETGVLELAELSPQGLIFVRG